MKCVVGLGNPGRKYAGTRHNIGYMVLDKLAREFNAKFEEYGFSDIAKITLGEEPEAIPVILLRPLTYMNESGRALVEAIEDFHLSSGSILVIHDDMDLPFGKIRVKRKGSSGGHRGVQSIITHIGTDEFPRLKVGIGRPDRDSDAIAHVLEVFREDEKSHLDTILGSAMACSLEFLRHGIDAAMSRYNGYSAVEENEEE